MSKLEIKNMSAKQKRQLHSTLRAVIQVVFFLCSPSAFTAAFAGVKYIFTQLGAKEPIGITSFVTVLIALCVYTFLFGRFFCGYACAFGAVGDAVHALYTNICKKLKKKPVKINENVACILNNVKYLILLAIVLLCFTGVYGKTQGYSPWDVFSMIQAGNFKLSKYVVGVILLLLIMAGMAVQERFFCRFLCPMGAVFALLPVLPVYGLFREKDNCLKGCKGCTINCPVGQEIPEKGSIDVAGDCIQCQKCVNVCPKSNIQCGIGTVKGNEVWFTLARAILLFSMFLWLGI